MEEYYYGININNSNDNIIKDNIIIDNYIGIKLGCYNPKIYTYNNIIENNIIEYNIRDGLYIHNSYNSIISNNTISFNGEDGICIPWYKSSNNLIVNNNISSNNRGGIWFTGDNNIIKSNNIVNHKTGIFFFYSIKNKILHNNIYLNERNANIHVALIGLFFGHMWSNKWEGNYWGKSPILFKMIFGEFHVDEYNDFFKIPLISFDWHPAQEPYDIGI
jgi:parallel beta-helix repeat protein